MAGRAGRTYKRDASGRFASTGGGGSKRPAAKRVAKGPNRLTRDNSGKITSVGGDGATMRGGRLKTASGKLRARQVANISGGRAGIMGKGGKKSMATSSPVTQEGRAIRKKDGWDYQIGAKAKSLPRQAGRFSPKPTAKMMENAGGSRWQKNGMDRIYFNNQSERIGVAPNRGSGKNYIFKGDDISKGTAGRIKSLASTSKVFFDVPSKKIKVRLEGISAFGGLDQKVEKALKTTVRRQAVRTLLRPGKRKKSSGKA